MKNSRRTVRGTPITVGAMAVTPLIEVREVSIESMFGGLTVAALRPTAVELRDGDGQPQRLKIPNSVRWVRLSMVVAIAAAHVMRRRHD